MTRSKSLLTLALMMGSGSALGHGVPADDASRALGVVRVLAQVEAARQDHYVFTNWNGKPVQPFLGPAGALISIGLEATGRNAAYPVILEMSPDANLDLRGVMSLSTL
jgi:hypothetical protein